MRTSPVLERLWQKSGFDILVTLVAVWVAADIVEWVGWLNLETPWDGIAKKGAAIVAAFLRLRFLAASKPTVRAIELSPAAVRQLPLEERATVEKAIARQEKQDAADDARVGIALLPLLVTLALLIALLASCRCPQRCCCPAPAPGPLYSVFQVDSSCGGSCGEGAPKEVAPIVPGQTFVLPEPPCCCPGGCCEIPSPR